MTVISGRVAVITGAARGIGRALVDRFLDAGAQVVALDRDLDGLPGSVLPVAADITDRDAVAAARDRVLDRFGRVDVLVNNAAMRQRDRFAPAGLSTVLGASDADWQAMFTVNVLGTLTVVREFVPSMIAAGGGGIVCIGTTGTMTAAPRAAARAGRADRDRHRRRGLERAARARRSRAVVRAAHQVNIAYGPGGGGGAHGRRERAHRGIRPGHPAAGCAPGVGARHRGSVRKTAARPGL